MVIDERRCHSNTHCHTNGFGGNDYGCERMTYGLMERQTNPDRKEQQQSPQITTVLAGLSIEVHLSRIIVVMMTVIIDSEEQVEQE